MINQEDIQTPETPELPIPEQLDIRSSEACIQLFEEADLLIEAAEGNVQSLLDIEQAMYAGDPHEYTILQHMVVKAAISKQRILDIDKPLFLEVIVPAYHEVIRMAPRVSSQQQLMNNHLQPDVNGEDALLRKYLELEWLAQGTKLEYQLRVVDDICDHRSGEIARQLIEANKLENTCSVHFLEDEIKSAVQGTLKHKAIETIIKKNESIRGGALCLGFAEAVEHIERTDREANTIISYVDADSSYSLTQAGIPIWELHSSPVTQVVTASRQSPLTYIEPPKETSQTSGRSSGLIRLKQVVGFLRQTVLEPSVPADTQSGFKFFRPEAIRYAVAQPAKAHNFSFDTQLLSRIARKYPNKEALKTFGVVLIDCDELTTANNGLTYFYASQIIKELAGEIGFETETAELSLLKFLTEDIENYRLVKRILEDNSDITEWFPEKSEEYALLASIRQRIQTCRDTTAVGDYFTSSICVDIMKILQKISM